MMAGRSVDYFACSTGTLDFLAVLREKTYFEYNLLFHYLERINTNKNVHIYYKQTINVAFHIKLHMNKVFLIHI